MAGNTPVRDEKDLHDEFVMAALAGCSAPCNSELFTPSEAVRIANAIGTLAVQASRQRKAGEAER